MLSTYARRAGWNWDPLGELRRIRRDMDRAMGSGWLEPEFPPVNVWVTDEEVKVTAELPGMAAEDLDIAVQGNTLTFRGERELEQLKDGEAYHRQERSGGRFVRSLQLPYEIDAEKTQANLANGILTLTLPRSEAEKPRKITVASK